MAGFSQRTLGLLPFWIVNSVSTGFVLDPPPPIVVLERTLLLAAKEVIDNPCITTSRKTSRYFGTPMACRGQEQT